jgi:signal transduction histidine kinase
VIGSVRARLTIAVGLVVGGLAISAALIAPRSVERALVDDRLDGEVATEAATLARTVTLVSPVGTTIGSTELTALFGPDIADLITALDGTGAIEAIRSLHPDGRLLVTPAAGVVGDVGRDGRIRVAGRSSQSVDGPIITGARLEQLAGALGTASVFSDPFEVFSDAESFDDYIAELDRRLDGDLGAQLDLGDLPVPSGDLLPRELFDVLQRDRAGGAIEAPDAPEAPRGVDQVAFGIRTVNGLDVIVTAPTDGIDLTVDRVRTAVWTTLPIAVALTALITWLLAGRALRPVRAITEQTGRIRSGTLHERVPVPNSHDEIAGLATEMNDMLDRLQREDQRRREFVADASHELRSPIAAIQTQAEVALSTDAHSRELAEGVLAEAARLGTIVDDLLSIARHDEQLAPPGAIVDLDDIVLAEAVRPRRVRVETSRVSAGQIRGRADELTRVVTHLLDNAARHADELVRVDLTTTADGAVQLDVHDDGPGISPADRERVFERFVRLDEARVRDRGGAGLGLAVVATVVRATGGHVDVEDSDLGGARFRLTFPGPT